ncbi:sigma-54-dependent Fis family transcriptional regulator, partial [Burkholderia sp. Cy-647]|uniref:VpsR-related response regulator n=1 Tax=Burkholderia sp. Cy-647 TaxID=2608328 RepID=UPI001D26ED00|nr:sigma-54-dependent Fis family transcriptional regulator [Burkholderia sp. Cy-647]
MHESRVPPGVIAADFSRRRRAATETAEGARALVYLARRPDPVLVAFLSQHGWSVSLAASPAEFARRPAPRRAQAGIVALDDLADDELAALDGALRCPATAWIALAEAARFDRPEVRRLVRHYCFDYLQSGAPPATL